MLGGLGGGSAGLVVEVGGFGGSTTIVLSKIRPLVDNSTLVFLGIK